MSMSMSERRRRRVMLHARPRLSELEAIWRLKMSKAEPKRFVGDLGKDVTLQAYIIRKHEGVSSCR